MKTIYKYPLKTTTKQTITNDPIEKLLHVGVDPQGVPCVWAEVDTEHITLMNAAKVNSPTTVYVIGTGEEIPCNAEAYLGSFVIGQYVWHVYS